jgi:hypothetical protein
MAGNGQAKGSACRDKRSSGFHQDSRRYGKTIFPGWPIEFTGRVREAGWIEQKNGIFPVYGSRDRFRDVVRMFRKTGFTTGRYHRTGRKSGDLPGKNIGSSPDKSADCHTRFTTIDLQDRDAAIPVVPGRVCPGK